MEKTAEDDALNRRQPRFPISERAGAAENVRTENRYRCPACGEMVNSSEVEEVRLHHDHVLHPARPAWFPPTVR